MCENCDKLETSTTPLDEESDLLPEVFSENMAGLQDALLGILNRLSDPKKCTDSDCVAHNRISGSWEDYNGSGVGMISTYEAKVMVQTMQRSVGGDWETLTFATPDENLSMAEIPFEEQDNIVWYDHPDDADWDEISERHELIVSTLRGMSNSAKALEDALETRNYEN